MNDELNWADCERLSFALRGAERRDLLRIGEAIAYDLRGPLKTTAPDRAILAALAFALVRMMDATPEMHGWFVGDSALVARPSRDPAGRSLTGALADLLVRPL